MIASAGELGGSGKGALVDAHIPVVAQVRLDDVIQFNAARWPSQIREIGQIGLRRVFKCPGEYSAHIDTMVVLTGLLRLVAKDPLVDGDVAIIAQMGFYDVIQIDTRRRPLRVYRGRQDRRSESGHDRDQECPTSS